MFILKLGPFIGIVVSIGSGTPKSYIISKGSTISSTIVSLSPTSKLSGKGLSNFIKSKNWLGLDLSISILTPIIFKSLPKFKLKSLRYVELFTAWIKVG